VFLHQIWYNQIGDKMKKLKQFKTHEEQIEILKSKGLIIDYSAIDVLKRNNYYFLINRYKDIFTIPNSKPSKFKQNVNFEEIVALYHFDNDLRTLILKYIIIIENTLKSILSYEFSKKYRYGYLDEKNFITSEEIKKEKSLKSLFNSINQAIKKGIKTKKYIKYYHKHYSQIPLWVIINDLSLSLTIKFFNLLKNEDKYIISNYFNVNSEDFYIFLQIIKFYRNESAHNQRIFDSKCEFFIKENSYHKKLKINNSNQGKNDVLALIIIFKVLLTDEDFNNFKTSLIEILEIFDSKVDAVQNSYLLHYMGLTNNWHTI